MATIVFWLFRHTGQTIESNLAKSSGGSLRIMMALIVKTTIAMSDTIKLKLITSPCTHACLEQEQAGTLKLEGHPSVSACIQAKQSSQMFTFLGSEGRTLVRAGFPLDPLRTLGNCNSMRGVLRCASAVCTQRIGRQSSIVATLGQLQVLIRGESFLFCFVTYQSQMGKDSWGNLGAYGSRI